MEKLKNSKVIKKDGKPYGRMTQLWRLFGINEAIDTVNQLAEEYAKDTYVQTIDVAELVEKKVHTNADCIRAMSDEELAINMMCPNENGLGNIECNRDDSCNCYECLLKWLQSEVEG